MWLSFILIFNFYSLLLARPNFIFILTDDQDSALGGLTPTKKIYSLIAENGAEFKNMFVTTPLCCPSRASILTGKYSHNHKVTNNSVNGNCNSELWQKEEEPHTFITHLKNVGYLTFYGGKYLNQYGKVSTGGVKHIPPGWDHWFALVGNSVYYNYSLSVNGKKVVHGSDYKDDYLTDVIFREAVRFLNAYNETQPFFLFLSPPSPHAPFTAAPHYQTAFPNMIAPRIPNFNIPGGKGKHWLLRQPPSPLSKQVINAIDNVFRNRWQTLLSVDDGVAKLIKLLEQKNILNQTYVFFTSDNGFHTGQFSLPWDKRQPYEFDVRVPLLVRGPNIKPGVKHNHPVLNIDLAPTILQLAGVSATNNFNGESFMTLLSSKPWTASNRTHFIIEHHGEASERAIPGCPQYKSKEVDICEIDCICEDSWNNTYTCIRELSSKHNFLTCLFKDEGFVEAYNLTDDPFQLHNLYPDLIQQSKRNS